VWRLNVLGIFCTPLSIRFTSRSDRAENTAHMKKINVFTLPEKMYHMYLSRREADLARLKEAVSRNSRHEFSVIGHQLQGNAPSFGFDEMAELGERFCALTAHQVQSRGPLLLAEYDRLIAAARKKWSH
jgi:HPt (histidine-containing phosphotransfer) domain-containing protein